MKISRNPKEIHPPVAPYVHQIEITGPNRWLTFSGQIGMALDGTVPEDPIIQLQLALNNIKKNLECAGMTVADLTKVVFYLVGEFDTAQRKHVMGDFFGDHCPCMTMVYVCLL